MKIIFSNVSCRNCFPIYHWFYLRSLKKKNHFRRLNCDAGVIKLLLHNTLNLGVLQPPLGFNVHSLYTKSHNVKFQIIAKI